MSGYYSLQVDTEKIIMDKKYYATKLGPIAYAGKEGKPLIVFLNVFGTMDTEQNFAKVIARLPKEYGIFAPDYLNTGFSGKSNEPYSLTTEADELATIINGFNAAKVIIVAHSVGGVYAFQMQAKIKNLHALIFIEPTTREIILDPPKEKSYLDHDKETADTDQFIHDKIFALFSDRKANDFWQTTLANEARFDEQSEQELASAIEDDGFWQSSKKLDGKVPVTIFTEAYRQKEYERSEYNNQNAKIIPLGTFHYIQWEYPEEIAQEIISASAD